MTVHAGGDPAARRDPVAVRVIRGLIAVLVWAALSFPVSGMFRWVGDVLAMPPSYGPAWKLFVVAVGVVLFLAFVLEPYSGDETSEGDDPRARDPGAAGSGSDDAPRDEGGEGGPSWSRGDA
ncbi:MAG TPA: hypothetical protein VJ925_03230 [Longimicrobiales bacterium]|nr:hypothetical protein [Longimicrobiales bacterium]